MDCKKDKFIKSLYNQWQFFKKKRNMNLFYGNDNKGFISIKEREKMIDELFKIILHKKDE